MSVTITRVITGDVSDLTGVTLLTLVRADTGASVTIPGGGVFTLGTGNAWSIAFTSPASGLTYAYTYRRTFADGSHLDGAGTVVDATGTYTGRYTSEQKIGAWIGEANLTNYADVNDDGTRDDGAVQLGITSSEADVDLRTGGPYTFTNDAAGTIAAQVFERWARVIASVELAEKRLGQSAESVKSLLAIRKDVYDEMEEFYEGKFALVGAVGPADPAGTGILDAQASLAPMAGAADCGCRSPGAADVCRVSGWRRW